MKVWVNVKECGGITDISLTTHANAARPAFLRIATDNDGPRSRVRQYEVNLETLEVHVSHRHEGKEFATWRP